jgi:hypothetical protein
MPTRFLTFCRGTNFYTDGDFDAWLGFTKIALLDVQTKRTLYELKDSFRVGDAALSPNGKFIAVIKGKKLRIYDAP